MKETYDVIYNAWLCHCVALWVILARYHKYGPTYINESLGRYSSNEQRCTMSLVVALQTRELALRGFP